MKGWLLRKPLRNQVALMLPVSSPKAACMDQRFGLTRLAETSQTSATIVCSSPGLSSATLRVLAKSWCLLGRW